MSLRWDQTRIVYTVLSFTLLSVTTRAAVAAAGGIDGNLASVGAASVPPTTPTEKRAAQLSKVAVGADFDAGRFKAGESKLKEAIRLCKPEVCSKSFQARLHRDLGFLYVAGLENAENGEAEFELALDLDPTVILPFVMQTGAVRKVFAETKQRIATRGSEPAPKSSDKLPRPAPVDVRTAKPEPKPKKPSSIAKTKSKAGKDKKKATEGVQPEEVELEEEPTAESADADSNSEPDGAKSKPASDDEKESNLGAHPSVANWLTLSLQQDLVLHTKSANVCAVGSRYECFDSSGANQVLPIGANQVGGTTMSRGPVRLLLGYERLVYPDASIGVRVGAALFGKAPRLKTDPGYFFMHIELRATLWLGHESFTRAGLRPYLYGCGGFGEADGRVTLAHATSSGGPPLDAWKRSGHVFAGFGLGLQYAYKQSRAVYAELNYLSFMNPDVPVFGIQLGYAYGI